MEWGAAQGLHGSRLRELPPGQGRVMGAARSSSPQDGGTGRTNCRKTFVEPADFIRTGEDFWAAGLLAPCGSDVRLSMKTSLSAGTGERLGAVAGCCGRRGPSSGEGSLSCGGPWGSGGCALQPERRDRDAPSQPRRSENRTLGGQGKAAGISLPGRLRGASPRLVRWHPSFAASNPDGPAAASSDLSGVSRKRPPRNAAGRALPLFVP